ncbi:MAG: 3-phosphoshikimate 1-carboxyvinyltransferase [Bacillota bacterium]|nr:3-phosphoshikimate 1-carboxyvinyltransferase [Bacillota bacterium]
MSQVSVQSFQGKPLIGEISPPGDKSISHRALLLAALASGPGRLVGLAPGRDVAATARCLRALGVVIRPDRPRGATIVRGRLDGDTLSGPALREPQQILDCGNAGTTMRLLLGTLAGQALFAVLTGDRSLRRRPMGRVTGPLAEMGASFSGRDGGRLAPIAVRGGRLHPAAHRIPVASAQVKSAILLAGLFAEGATSVAEPAPSRDHTERMLLAMGAEVRRISATEASVSGPAMLSPLELTVPGDPSSAAFIAAASLLVPGSSVHIRGVSLNPGRMGFFELLRRAGAGLSWEQTGVACGEPVGDIEARASAWGPLTVRPPEVPSMLDELPLVALLAARADGRSEISGAAELRTKESDRLAGVASGLRALGVTLEERPDGLIIEGPSRLTSPVAPLPSAGDHRLAMTWAVAGLACRGNLRVAGMDSAAVSYPGFLDDIAALTGVRGRP